MNEFLDFEGLKYFKEKLKQIFYDKDDVDKLIQQKTFDEWLEESDKVYPAGSILVYTNRTTIDGQFVPDIKIADGKTTVGNLSFYEEKNSDSLIEDFFNSKGIQFSNDGEITAKRFNGPAARVEHSLTIGKYKYDGSEDVTVPTYYGE